MSTPACSLQHIPREYHAGDAPRLQHHNFFWWKVNFADYIDLIGGSKNELKHLNTILEVNVRAYGMEVSSEKSKVLVNSTNQNIPINIIMNGQDLES